MTTLRDGEPCSHPGCLSHISHPCECAAMAQLKAAEIHERSLASAYGRCGGKQHVDAALELRREMAIHQQSCKQCQPGPGEKGE